MSLIPHSFFPRSMFDMDQWHRPFSDMGLSTMDLFDPFDELDHMMGNKLFMIRNSILAHILMNKFSSTS